MKELNSFLHLNLIYS